MDATFVVVELMGSPAVPAGDAAPLDRVRAIAREACSPADQVVKVHGASVLLASPEPGAALEMLRRLRGPLALQGDLAVRIGAHHGEAVRRSGQWFGTAINIAARICAHARRGQILVTEEVARRAQENGFLVADLGTIELPSILAPVQLYALEAEPSLQDPTRDPVCEQIVDPDAAVGRLRHLGTDYYFCSLECAARFAATPETYTSA